MLSLADSIFPRTLSLGSLLNDSTIIKRFWHTSVSVWTIFWMIYGGILMLMYANEDDPNEFFRHGYKYRAYFLSLWLTAAQYLYFSLYSAIDILEVYQKGNSSIEKWTTYIHNFASYLLFSIIFPLSLFVFITFWGTYLWNRDVIYPEIMDLYIPTWLNHAMHTIPVPLSILYMLTSNRTEPSKMATFSGLVGFLAIYSYIFFSMKQTSGKWIYIVFEKTTPTQTQFIFTYSAIAPIIFLFLGYKINSIMKYLRTSLNQLLVH